MNMTDELVANRWTTRDATMVAPPPRGDLIVGELDDAASVWDPRSGVTHHVNEVAYHVWRSCDGVATAQQIAERLADEFDVELEVALDDVEQLIATFAELRLIAENR